MKHSKLSYFLRSKLLNLLKFTAAGITIQFFNTTYIVHKIAKDLESMARLLWPGGQAAGTAESSIVTQVIFMYVLIHVMGR